MSGKLFKFLCLICVFSVLNVFCGCTSKQDMVTDQDIIELYNENKELFDKTAKKVEELNEKLQEINGLSFRYIEHRVEAYLINTQISFNFPNDLYSDLLDCFIEMESIINEEYDEDEYVLIIRNNIKNSTTGEANVTQFLFVDEVIDLVSVLTYSEDKGADSYITINDNWYITSWAQV